MARGVFSGMLVGIVVAGLGLAGLLVAYRDVRPFTNNANAPAPEVAVSGPAAGDSAGEERAPATGATMGTGDSGVAPQPVSPGAAPAIETPPASQGAMTMPEVSVEGASLPPGSEAEAAPVMAGTQAAPEVGAPGDATDTPPAEAPPATQSQPTTPEVQAELEGAGAAPEAGTGPAMPAGADSDTGAAMPAAPGNVSPGAVETPPAASDAPAPPALPATLALEEGADVPGTEAGQIGDIAENVVTGRLPSIGATAAEEETAAPAASTPAIVRNAARFESTGAEPLMAVVLLDEGASRTDLGDLKNLPFAITFVVDVTMPDAAEAVQFYRQAGAEVVVQVPLPAGATPADVETNLQAYQPLLDQAVAVMIPGASGFQTPGDGATQLAVILREDGLGLITLPQGLNTGHKAALRGGVAAGLIFRELDNDGQSGAVIRRFMDNAAFKARQNKGVILLGHARAETIQALIEWSLGNRAKSVALAPVSVVLQDQ